MIINENYLFIYYYLHLTAPPPLYNRVVIENYVYFVIFMGELGKQIQQKLRG
jgi:hypothetical protein